MKETQPIELEKEMLRARSPKEFTSGLFFIGRVFVDQCWPNLEQALLARLALMRDSELKLAKYTRQTYLCIVLFYSYVDGTALSIKKLLQNGSKRSFLEKLSNNQKGLLKKPDDRITFEELMKVQFSILPHAVGAPVEYGTIKQQWFGPLFELRKIRNRIVHPSGLEDFVAVNLDELKGHDINQPMAAFMEQLNNTIVRSARRMIPADTRNTMDLHSWIRTRRFTIDS